jgi:protein disulfide-isomerase A6
VSADPRLASRVVIAKINADEHRSLGERFAVRGFPTLKMFKRGAPVDASAENYNGPRSAAEMLSAIQSALDADAGFARLEALDALAAAVAKSGGGDALVSAVDALKKAAAKVQGEGAAAAALYAKAAAKAVDKGVDYFAAEHARLSGLIGQVSAAKADELARRMSVLTAFMEGEEGDASAAAA